MGTKIKSWTKPGTETEQLFADLNKPSLHGLSYALRHPDTWPEGFVWDYSNCNTCAMGLAHALWKSTPEVGPRNGASVMAKQFAMPYEAAASIFMGARRGHHADWMPTVKRTEGALWWKAHYRQAQHGDVTPEMVAEQIDKHLAEAE